MEPSGRNRWQLAANRAASETAKPRENRCRGLRPVASDKAAPVTDGAAVLLSYPVAAARARPRGWFSGGSLAST
jgi:hypothetical protein